MRVDSKAYKFFVIFSFWALPLILLAGLATAGDRLLLSWQAFSAICSQTWDLLIGYAMQYNNFWSLLIIILFGLALVNAVFYIIGQYYKSYLLKKKFQSTLLFSKKIIHVVESEDLFAVTAGFFRPQIYLSAALFNRLSQPELKAVIAHEKYHQLNRHPFYLLLTHSLSRLLFFLPVVQSLLAYTILRYETLADNFAMSKTSKKDLSSALYKIIGGNSLKFPETTSTFSTTKDRVEILTGEAKIVFKWPKFLTIFSLAIVFFLSSFLSNPVTLSAAGAATVAGLEENGYSVAMPVDCYSPAESLVSLVKFGQQSEANMTYVITR